MHARFQRLWLCLPAVVLGCGDGLLTLAGQPAAYWSDGFQVVREANPLAAWLLTVHPLAFAAAAVPYLLLVMGTVMLLPRYWAATVAAGIALVHLIGVGLWCTVLLREPLIPLAGIGAAVVCVSALAWRQARKATIESSVSTPTPASQLVECEPGTLANQSDRST
jgi:hypothetical protein